jgi:hypothetical protein
MSIQRLVALGAALVLSSPAAFAQNAPAATPVLQTTSGLEAPTSRSPIGFVPPSATNLNDYVDAVGGIQVTASFESSQASTIGADSNGKNALVSLQKGATVSLQASYSKKNGQPSATLDSITLTSSGATVGPGLKLEKAEIHSDGTMSVKLNSWIPTLNVTKVQKQPNGDVKLQGSWWGPDVTIKADGSVYVGKQISIFGKKIGPLSKIGNVNPSIFASWPPSLSDMETLLKGKSAAPSGDAMAQVNKLAGKLTYDVKANAVGLPITFDGTPVTSKEALEAKGQAQLANGTIATIGSTNTTHVQIDLTPGTYGDGQNGLTIKSGGATLDGAYKLTMPLADPAKNMTVSFDGNATYQMAGSNVHLTLPNGASVSIAQASIDRTGAIHADTANGQTNLQLADASYDASVSGPIHVEKLGPISSLDLDGQLSSKGLARIGSDGTLTLQGTVGGEEVVTSSGMLPILDGGKGYYSSSFKPGTKVDVALDQFQGVIGLPLSAGSQLALESGSAQGTVSLQGGLTSNEVKTGVVDARLPDADVGLTLKGNVAAGPNGVSGAGTVKGSVSMPNGGAVALDLPLGEGSATIDSGAAVNLDATITKAPGTPGATGTQIAGTVSGQLGVSNTDAKMLGVDANLKDDIQAQLNAPFVASVGSDGQVALDPTKTSASVPVKIALHKGSEITIAGQSVTVQDDDSSIQLTGDFAVDATGQPVLKDLKNVALQIQLGGLTANVLGKTLNLPQVATLHYTGDASFVGSTITIHGTATATEPGKAAPVVTINL